jgi:3'-phosphoadenosine 5'-phosphosulfate (PAPS) 3'-phosphatase
LDGTLPFVEGQEGYAVSIALVSCEGEALLAAVYDPYLQKLWSNDSLQTYEKKQNGNRLTLFCDRSLIKNREYPLVDSIISQLKNQYGFSAVEVHQQFGAVKNALGVLTTPNSLYLKLPKPEQGGGSLWDFAATMVLFQKLKLPCGGIDGRPVDFNKTDSLFLNDSGILYASDMRIFTGTVKVYQSLVNH